ncbi:MAG TPA: tRNA (adenosine(37)-N6)-threonylcarbamoyltransferase complex dimerization subunit type 1 TsaB [Erysipelotrichaceae bacterium]|jgi:tRNA threonylcarbamoyladenosine biosynthesis protein TsaB|nr:tRNA (adenosine(37)-N6)-threonylcarbamoyltransferase complex dimerization subunit type 1 TsaB [Bacillota bacterium]HCY07119.1 tRNA (adenosine(37)-N6)-threonylcarbamoyltransferase complex dimerization subunit type 1 TsaB [Erysipelotrichaceae bacterium]
MLTLCMDTSHKYLSICLIKNDEIIASYSEECFKKQSEMIFVILDKLCKENDINPLDIKKVVVSKGPGSYTGVRIAMSVAKVMATLNGVSLYTIDTLKLYSDNLENCAVIMDARSNRAYFGIYNKGETVLQPGVFNIDDVKNMILDNEIVGDLFLLDKEDKYPNIPNSFLKLKSYWEKVDNIHLLTPVYLKDAAAYMVKK